MTTKMSRAEVSQKYLEKLLARDKPFDNSGERKQFNVLFYEELHSQNYLSLVVFVSKMYKDIRTNEIPAWAAASPEYQQKFRRAVEIYGLSVQQDEDGNDENQDNHEQHNEGEADIHTENREEPNEANEELSTTCRSKRVAKKNQKTKVPIVVVPEKPEIGVSAPVQQDWRTELMNSMYAQVSNLKKMQGILLEAMRTQNNASALVAQVPKVNKRGGSGIVPPIIKRRHLE